MVQQFSNSAIAAMLWLGDSTTCLILGTWRHCGAYLSPNLPVFYLTGHFNYFTIHVLLNASPRLASDPASNEFIIHPPRTPRILISVCLEDASGLHLAPAAFGISAIRSETTKNHYTIRNRTLIWLSRNTATPLSCLTIISKHAHQPNEGSSFESYGLKQGKKPQI